MFRTVPLSIVRSFSLYKQQWHMSHRRNQSRPDPARKLSANLYDIYHCCVYSEKLLMMHSFLKLIFGIKLYMFRTVPPSIISSSLHTQQCYMSYSMTYTTAVCAVKNS